MLSTVGESAQVALQAGTVASKADSKSSDRPVAGSGVKRPRDTVTISPEAIQRTHAALNALDKSHERRLPDREEEAADSKNG